MNTRIADSQPIRRTCVLCNRDTTTGRESPVGHVGPECHRKIAALPQMLRAAGMPALIDTGSAVVQTVERDGNFFFPPEVLLFNERMKQGRSGLRLQFVAPLDHSQHPPLATVRLVVRSAKHFVRHVRSFEQAALTGTQAVLA